MAEDSPVGPAHEYDTLRHELFEAKRYIIERPLAIAALAAIGLQFFDKPQGIALPIAVSCLALINFSFTVKELESASRIVAYIQLVLEPSASYAWAGWETSLREYRKWLKARGRRQVDKYVAAKIDPAAAPATLLYYPTVYGFHVVLMLFSISAGAVQFKHEATPLTRFFSLIAVVLGIWLLIDLLRWMPHRLRFSIERKRVIWQAVLEGMASQEQKQTRP